MQAFSLGTVGKTRKNWSRMIWAACNARGNFIPGWFGTWVQRPALPTRNNITYIYIYIVWGHSPATLIYLYLLNIEFFHVLFVMCLFLLSNAWLSNQSCIHRLFSRQDRSRRATAYVISLLICLARLALWRSALWRASDARGGGGGGGCCSEDACDCLM